MACDIEDDVKEEAIVMQPHLPHRLRAGIVLAVAAASLSVAAVTLGAPTRAGRAIQVFVTPSVTGHGGGSILITGAIGDYGKSIKANAAGQPDAKGGYSLAKLHYGSILLNTKQLTKRIQTGSKQAKPDLASCSLHGSTSANIPILSGRGHYSGISGSVHVRFNFAEVTGRYTSGTKKGKCNLAAGPVAQWVSIVGAGAVTLK